MSASDLSDESLLRWLFQDKLNSRRTGILLRRQMPPSQEFSGRLAALTMRPIKGAIFRRSGHPIRRHRQPVVHRGEVVYVEGGGAFYDFLEFVLKPLRAHLREILLAPVTTETIIRCITEDFPKAS